MGLPNVLPNSIYIRISRCIIPSLARLYPPFTLINSLSWPSFQFINPLDGLSMQIADSYQSRRQIVNIQLCAVISNFSSDHPTPHEVSLASNQPPKSPSPPISPIFPKSTISDSENETRRKTFEHWLVATNGQTKQLVGNESEIDREIEIMSNIWEIFVF